MPSVRDSVRERGVAVGHVDPHRHRDRVGGMGPRRRRQPKQQLELARGARGPQALQRRTRQCQVVGGHGDPAGAPGEPVDEGQEARMQIHLGRTVIGPASLHHSNRQAELDRQVGIAEAATPSRRESDSELRVGRRCARYQCQRPIGGLHGERVEMNPNPGGVGSPQELGDQLTGESERRRLDRKVGVKTALRHGLGRGPVRASNLVGFLASLIPKADGARPPAFSKRPAGEHGIGEPGPRDVGRRGPPEHRRQARPQRRFRPFPQRLLRMASLSRRPPMAAAPVASPPTPRALKG